jgi:DnaJ-class molecular chaperone
VVHGQQVTVRCLTALQSNPTTTWTVSAHTPEIMFPHAGNEVPPTGEAQDLVFVAEEKLDEVWSRDGNDLIAKVNIPLVGALTGPSTSAPNSGEKVWNCWMDRSRRWLCRRGL